MISTILIFTQHLARSLGNRTPQICCLHAEYNRPTYGNARYKPVRTYCKIRQACRGETAVENVYPGPRPNGHGLRGDQIVGSRTLPVIFTHYPLKYTVSKIPSLAGLLEHETRLGGSVAQRPRFRRRVPLPQTNPNSAVSLQVEKKTARTINSSLFIFFPLLCFYALSVDIAINRDACVNIFPHPPLQRSIARNGPFVISEAAEFFSFFSFSRGLLISMKIPDRSTMEYSLLGPCITGIK